MEKDYKHIVRVASTDIDGKKQIVISLTKIKGVGRMFANAACHIAGIETTKKTGYLLDSEVKKLDEIIRNPSSFNMPRWMLNRRNDYETGEDMHLLTGNLGFVKDNDIKRLKKIRAYRGVRHMFSLPTRGQRTKSNFRRNKGKGSLGVQRKKVSRKT